MISDTITLVVTMIGLFIFAFIGNATYMFFNDAIQEDNTFTDSIKSDVQYRSGEYASVWDNVIFLTFIALWLVALMASFLINTHPVFYVISILSFVFIVIIGGVLAIFIDDIVNDTHLSPYTEGFPKTLFLVENLVAVLFGVAFTIGLVLFGKTQV